MWYDEQVFGDPYLETAFRNLLADGVGPDTAFDIVWDSTQE